MSKGVITDEEFDKLQDQTQMEYMWCEFHQLFWNKKYFDNCPVTDQRGAVAPVKWSPENILRNEG